MKSVFILLLLHSVLMAQSLPLPPRPANAPTGSQMVTILTPLTLELRENEIHNQILSGNMPDFMRNLVPVTTTVSGNSVTYFVIPEYLALGSNDDYFLIPMTPLLAQKIANAINCVLPTKRMVDQIYTASACKLRPQPIPPSGQMTTVPVFSQHNDSVKSLRLPLLGQYPLGTLVGGTKKDVIISNRIYTNLNPNTPKPVVIYGWHQLNGSPIQPVYNGHGETYADYSHGIRLVLDSFVVNSSYKKYAALLADPVLSVVISDEGVISKPYYTLSGSTTPQPQIFAVRASSASQITVKAQFTPASIYKAFYGTSPAVFNDSTDTFTDSITITGLTEGLIYYVRIRAMGQAGYSPFSEVLAAVPSAEPNQMIIVNGFDRAVTGNTNDFVKRHGPAFLQAGLRFDACTNEAVITGLLSLKSYKIADYILGTESTANETFSSDEQSKVIEFLKGGGYLFASGSEIAWDLDNRGSASDKDFIRLYLKTQYINDAPGGLANTYYTASGLPGEVFSGVNSITFDNGNFGTFNVGYPDVIQAINGSTNLMQYSGTSGQMAATGYAGLFPGGSLPGRLIVMGFPFEAIYPEAKRNEVAQKIAVFFGTSTDIFSDESSDPPSGYAISAYPNPFNPTVRIRVQVEEDGNYAVKIYTVLGETAAVLHNGFLQKGNHYFQWNVYDAATRSPSGIYITVLNGNGIMKPLKLCVLK